MVSPLDGPGPSFELTTAAPAPGVLIVGVRGELDYLATPDLRRRLFDRLDAGPAILVVDLGDVRLLSAAAMELLLALNVMAAARGCEVRVVAASRAVRRPLALTGLDERLRMFDTVDAALEQERG